MALNKTLTATDAIVSVKVDNLFPVPQIIDGFEIDNAFQLSDINIAQTVLTLDGELTGGYVPSIVDFTINVLPVSLSKQFFVDWMQASKTNQTMFKATFNITIPGEKASYILTDVILVTGKILPSVNSILQPVSYKVQVSSKNIAAFSL